MSDNIIEKLHLQMLKFLPDAAEKAIKSYVDFTMAEANAAPQKDNEPQEKDPKRFSDHQSACKAALVHIDTLMKLTRWLQTEYEAKKPNDTQDTEEALARARAGLAKYKKDEEE